MQATPSVPDSTPITGIIRTGCNGRLRFPPEQRRDLLEGFDRSGFSAIAFARSHGLCHQTLIAWLRKRRSDTDTSAGPAFASLIVRGGRKVRARR